MLHRPYAANNRIQPIRRLYLAPRQEVKELIIAGYLSVISTSVLTVHGWSIPVACRAQTCVYISDMKDVLVVL